MPLFNRVQLLFFHAFTQVNAVWDVFNPNGIFIQFLSWPKRCSEGAHQIFRRIASAQPRDYTSRRAHRTLCCLHEMPRTRSSRMYEWIVEIIPIIVQTNMSPTLRYRAGLLLLVLRLLLFSRKRSSAIARHPSRTKAIEDLPQCLHIGRGYRAGCSF